MEELCRTDVDWLKLLDHWVDDGVAPGFTGVPDFSWPGLGALFLRRQLAGERSRTAPWQSLLMSGHDPSVLPADLPVPEDDGAADHLVDHEMPILSLPSTAGDEVDLRAASQGRVVVIFCYPRTGRPGVDPPTDWDLIPGARGCTPEACAFRDLRDEFDKLGVGLFGLSTQDPAYQAEAAERLHLTYPLLSDVTLQLTRALRLPTFEVEGMTFIRRLTLVVQDSRIGHLFYPVFPPDRHPDDVIAWLRSRSAPGSR